MIFRLHSLLETVARPLPTKPIVFGATAFGVLLLLLYLVLRMDRD